MIQVIETITSITTTTALRRCQDLLTTEAKVFFMSRPIFYEKRRAFPNSQHTLLREHSSLLRVRNAREVLQGERGTTSTTKGATSADICESIFLGYCPCSLLLLKSLRPCFVM